MSKPYIRYVMKINKNGKTGYLTAIMGKDGVYHIWGSNRAIAVHTDKPTAEYLKKKYHCEIEEVYLR